MAKARTNQHPFNIQVPAAKYLQTSYLSPERFSSIGYQFELAVETGGESFLNIGSAHGILEWLLIRSGLQVIGLDLDIELSSDVIGVLPLLPLNNRCVEVAMAFQVLEHMPIEMLKDCFFELKRVAKKNVIVSLPDQTPFWASTQPASRMESIGFRFHYWTWKRQERRLKAMQSLDPEHFWEIGYGNITYETINQSAADSGLEPIRMIRNPYFPYHTFFIFKIVEL